jgi:hypothetical protein
MRFYYDTEFVENGRTIDLLSIGIVADDGREYYAVVDDPTTISRAVQDEWLCANVVTTLPVTIYRNTPSGGWHWRWNGEHPDIGATRLPSEVAGDVATFLLGADRHKTGQLPHVELWADYAAYDHVALAQLFGRMIDLPEGIPMFTRDLRQEIARLDVTEEELPKQETGQHNALADARYAKRLGDYLTHLDRPEAGRG